MTQGPYRLKILAGDEEWKAGESMYQRGGVRVLETGAHVLRYVVAGTPRQEVIFTQDAPARCNCEVYQRSGACRHVVAATLLAQETGALEELLRRKAAAAAPRLMNAMERTLPEDGTLNMEITLMYDSEASREKPQLRVGIRVGEDRLYVVRSIPQFIESMDTGVALPFGKGFTFQPEWMHFTPAENRVLDILRALCLAQKDAGISLRGAELRVMALPEPFAAAMLDAMQHLPFRMAVDGKAYHVKGVRQTKLPLYYRVTGSLRGLTVTARFPKDFIPLTSSCAYGILSGGVVAVDHSQHSVLRVLLAEQYDGKSVFDYPTRETAPGHWGADPLPQAYGCGGHGQRAGKTAGEAAPWFRVFTWTRKARRLSPAHSCAMGTRKLIPSTSMRRINPWPRGKSCCCGTRQRRDRCWIPWPMLDFTCARDAYTSPDRRPFTTLSPRALASCKRSARYT